MRILYTVTNPYGLGADRWMYEGYKNAFISEGHEFFVVTENDDFQTILDDVQPNLLLLDFMAFRRYDHKNRPISPQYFEQVKKKGTRIFAMTATGIDREDETPENINFFRAYLPFFDICFCQFPPETTKNFDTLFGKKMYFIPHAADTTLFFPERPHDIFKCDIAFVGSLYTSKREQFERLLFPLMKKYHVKFCGPGWTFKDKILRPINGLGRKFKLKKFTQFVNTQRVSITQDDERRLYASAKICVNIHEYYRDQTIKGYSNEREFKVPASGGFQISDYIPGMERYFELGKEIVTVKSPEEWFFKIEYYLNHEVDRKKIQERGTARVLKEHSYINRVTQLINLYNSI